MMYFQKGVVMDLRIYLYTNRISITDFAKKLLVSRPYLSQICLGNLTPSRRLARDIELATQGKVSIDELLKDCSSQKKTEEHTVSL